MAADTRTVDVVLTAGDVVPGRLAGATALVIDVLRASTTIITALANGAAAVIPVESVEEARERAGALGRDAVLAGERHSDPPPGFDLGNSPLEFTPDRVRGRTVVMTTSNGTRALVAARGAGAVAVAALVNAGAAAAWAGERGGDVVIVCAGELGAPSLEDRVCAGVIAARLAAGGAGLTREAAAARALADTYGEDLARLGHDAPHARGLVAKGRGDDVAFCLALDTATLVPVLTSGVDKLVSGAIMQAAVRSGREVQA